jgi:signal peptidase complex subunit 1
MLSSQVVIIVAAVVAFAWGFVQQSFYQTFIIFTIGCTIAAILTLPPWPIYQKHPVQWLKPGNSAQPRSPATPRSPAARKKQ